MPEQTFCLPWPPSINGYWRSFRGRQILSKKAREYREAVLKSRTDPYCSWPVFEASQRLQVGLFLYPPDRRVRDIDNSAKGLLDALKHACVFVDDSQIDDLRIIRREVCKPGYVQVTIKEL